MNRILLAYIECALWSSTSDGEFLDSIYGIEDIHPDTIKKMESDVNDFLEKIQEIDTSDWSEDQLGHDFWLTRNSHGAGFWDRGLENGDELTEIAKQFREVELYVGDDNLIHQY